jgi:hypothetical protein
MGHPDAAYDLSPEAQGRLLGWLYARAAKSVPAKRPDPNRIDLVAMLRGGS